MGISEERTSSSRSFDEAVTADPNGDPYGKMQRKELEVFGEGQALPERSFPMVLAAAFWADVVTWA